MHHIIIRHLQSYTFTTELLMVMLKFSWTNFSLPCLLLPSYLHLSQVLYIYNCTCYPIPITFNLSYNFPAIQFKLFQVLSWPITVECRNVCTAREDTKRSSGNPIIILNNYHNHMFKTKMLMAAIASSTTCTI